MSITTQDAELVRAYLSKNAVTRPTAAQQKHYAEMERHARAEITAADTAYYRSAESRRVVWDPINNRFCEGARRKRNPSETEE